jgi:hypothetical protein
MIQSPYYWQAETNLRELIGHSGQSYKLRLVVNIKGGLYISGIDGTETLIYRIVNVR